MIKVSVIVPVYNVENYLSKCLDSLVSQTLNGMELLLIDDGSTDSSSVIIEQYKKKYPNLIRTFSKKNGGQGSARNLGIREATGEYIGFVDSDDYVSSDMFEKLYKKAKQENADIVTCNYYYLSGDKQEKIKLYQPKKNTDLFFEPWAAPWNKLYRRSIFVEHQIYYPEIRAYEDTAFYANMIPFVHTISNVDDALVYQVYRKSSTMNAAQNERVLLIFDVVQYIQDFYQKQGIYSQYYKYLEYFCSKILLSSSVLRICQIRDRKTRNEYLAKTLEEVKTRFPQYKKNKFFKKGIKGAYIRSISKFTIPIYAELIYVFRYFGRNRL